MSPIPYSMRNDVLVTLLMLCIFLLISLVFYKTWPRLVVLAKGLFQERERNNLFSETGVGLFHYTPFLITGNILTWALLAFYFLFTPFPEVLSGQSWQYLLYCIAGSAGLFILKYLLYSWVNWIFFDSIKRDRWMQVYNLLQSLSGVVLYGVTCLLIYSQISHFLTLILLIFVVGMAELLLFYKSYRIFFGQKFAVVAIILYFCTLEMIPFLIAGKVLMEYKQGFYL